MSGPGALVAAALWATIGKGIGIVLLVILGILLLILCMPFVYKGHVRKEEAFEANARVTWLFGVFRATVSFDAEQKLQKQIRFLGIPILDILEKKKARDAQKKEKKEPERSVRKSAPVRPSIQPGERKTKTPIEIDPPEVVRARRPGILVRLGARIEAFFRSIRRIVRKLARIRRIAEEWIDYLRSDSFDRAFHILLDHGGGIFRLIRPKRIRGEILFGTDDPAKTGEVLAAVSMLGTLWPQDLILTPDFLESRFEADVTFGGHLTIIGILWHAVATILHKEVRALIRRFRKGTGKASKKETRKKEWQTTENTMNFRTT